ncbi:MAG TPA: ankyrin repeat domain-containing protein [Pyrinomonadaceae bacterium]|nr:ankyrin repeat domain-containing protein [Pyrinomonadaceae bacterium]
MSTDKSLRSITVTSPCLADWDQMTGNDQVRFCEHCNLQVHNLSEMTYSRAARLVARSQGRLCVRYYRDSQGAPLTKLPTTRLHQIGRRSARLAAAAFSATLSLATAAAQSPPGIERNSSYNSPAQPNKQTFGASIVGTITDPNGAVISGASVSIGSNDSFSLFTSTNDEGIFRFNSVAAGVYSLRVSAPGFAPNQTGSIYVEENTETKVDRSLSVAGPESELEVVQTESVTVGGMGFVAPEDPMIKAAQEDNMEEVQQLLPGRNVNLRDKRSGTTALEHAVRNGNRELVQMLLSAGADVNTRNEGGQTVLMMLGEEATVDLVWDLINAGAKVNEKDNEGNTPLIEAAGFNNIEALKTLLDAGADVAARNQDGESSLMMAAAAGLVNNVRTLVLAGADINQRDSDDKSALSLAIENSHSAVIRLLRAQGAVELVAQAKPED